MWTMFSASKKSQESSSDNLGWIQKLKKSLIHSRSKLSDQIVSLFKRHKIDQDLYHELEAILLTADVGVETTQYLLNALQDRVKTQNITETSELKQALQQLLIELLAPLECTLAIETKKPFIIMFAGVNGSGKTTSIGKLAKYFGDQDKSVLLVAGDTFRAAAKEQLAIWADRNRITLITQQGDDPAAVIFDAIHSAKARGHDIVIADTAGRLPTQLHLMEEIKKIKRVIAKAEVSAPHEILLVIDANIGQNAISQVKAFDAALGISGLIITKLDGTAKGGAIVAIARVIAKPICFIGLGEGIDDLRPFSARDFVDALFN